MKEMRDASLELLIDLAQPTIHDRVLDYASGAGIAGFALGPEVSTVEAADELPDLLEEGQRLAQELGLFNVAFTLVDLHGLPHKDGEFSLVVCCNSLHLLPEPGIALAEMQRVLTSRGRIVVLDAVVDATNDRAFNELARLREPAHRRYFLIEELDAIAERAGLSVRRHVHLRRTVDLDYWLQAAAVPPPKAELIRSRFKGLPLDVQSHMDVVFADRMVSFSYDIAGLRLERP